MLSYHSLLEYVGSQYRHPLTYLSLQKAHEDYEDSTLYARSALEITGENLEDLLAYDDLFLDYFNAFLTLPVFPKQLLYNRLTGSFDEVDDTDTASEGSHSVGKLGGRYGCTDEEREQMLIWAKTNRLPLFLSTQLFREFKLCKLLLRPLDDRYSASRHSSQQIRGYSRQSESYVSSLSNSADNSANDVLEDEDLAFAENQFNPRELYRYQRPGSRAFSMPPPFHGGFESYFSKQQGSTTTGTQLTSPSKSASQKSKQKFEIPPLKFNPKGGIYSDGRRDVSFSNDLEKVQFDPQRDPAGSKSQVSRHSSKYAKNKKQPTSDAEEQFRRQARALSAPINYEDFMNQPFYGDFDYMLGEEEPEPNGQVYVTFDDEGVSEEQTETDVKNLEGRLKMSFQQLKEQLLGSYGGMDNFQQFLADTAGSQLINFWLDCEFFKDTMENCDEVEIMEKRNSLFRDIKDKYKLNLTKDAKEQIARASSNSTLSHTIFIRTQYDVLRRLRAYWVPRYILHQEHSKSYDTSLMRSDPPRWITIPPDHIHESMSFFPSISVVNSMPVRPDDVLSYSMTKSWDFVSKGGRRLDDRVTSAKFSRRQAPLVGMKERLIIALSADKTAGGPFERFLEKQLDETCLSNLLFWQDVMEYGAAEDRSADRLLRLCHAWSIYNKFISENSPYNISVSSQERDQLHQCLMSAQDFVHSSVFNGAKLHAVQKLEMAWIRFLKEDLKSFLDCRIRPGIESPPSTADVIEITLTDDDILIRRPNPWLKSSILPMMHGRKEYPTTDSQRLARRSEWDDLSSEQRAEIRAQRRAKRKEMERERRKAIRAAYRRVREAKNKKPTEEKKEGQDEMEFDEAGDEKKSAKPPPPFHDMVANKAILTNFKKHLAESDEKECLNMVSLYMDIENYLSYGSNKKEQQKKENHASYIQKTYLDAHSKKKVGLTDKIATKISSEKDRPKTPLLKEILHHVDHKIDEHMKAYLMAKAEEQGMEPGDLVKLSQAELTMRLGTDPAMMGAWKKKGGKKFGEDDSDEGKKKVVGTFTGEFDSEYSHPAIRVTFLEEDQDLEMTHLKSKRKVHFAHTGQPESDPSRSLPSQDDSESIVRLTSSQQAAYKHRKRMGKMHMKTHRAQPHKEDKEEFLKEIKLSSQGDPTLQMLYFYKYLMKYGQEDNMPLIEKDLFFYIEVQKFKDCSHAYSDEELLKKKVQCILDCFLDSITSPSIQVDLNTEVHQKTLRAAQKYLLGKEVLSNIFDEAQLSVFKELLPYWAGFKKSYSPPEDQNKRPITKYQKLLKKRLDTIENYVIPPNEFYLPSIPEGAVAAFTFTLADGIKLRPPSGRRGSQGDHLSSEENMVETPTDKESGTRSSRMDSRKHRPSIVGSLQGGSAGDRGAVPQMGRRESIAVKPT
ncbi:hypothetical protein CHS0354_039734 [Potamilus streckersoni]|uniref:RGS domain-containing protein n=1 Tax=Potamilus streckersoni TaxID=2493646 RepID=A0AAE0RMR4_9BIVA|nr:hypothetical protein CHS0354_039734 [Potamilus streckersoni]